MFHFQLIDFLRHNPAMQNESNILGPITQILHLLTNLDMDPHLPARIPRESSECGSIVLASIIMEF